MYFETAIAPVLGRWAAVSAAIATICVIAVGIFAELALSRLNASNFLP